MSRERPKHLSYVPALMFVASLLAVTNSDSVASAILPSHAALFKTYFDFVFLTLAWIAGAAILNQVLRFIVWDRLVARAIGGPVPGVLKEMAALLIYLVAITCVVGLVFDRSVTGFLAALGAGGVIVGFALRNLFADIFTGLAINIDRTFAIGDWVQINEGLSEPTVAQIREIGWRCTSLTTEEQTTVVVPNGMLGLERVVNITEPIEPTRFETTLTVEFAVPVDRVKRVLLASLRSLIDTPGFDTGHSPQVLVKKTSDLGVEYLLRFWILPWHPISPTSAQDQVLTSAMRYLSTAGLSLAYPKTDVYHEDMPNRQVDGHNREGVLELLSHIDVFNPLKRHELEQMVGELERRVVRPGKTLVREGEEGHSLFVLLEGLLDVHVDSNGQPTRVAMIEPGQCFGEMSLLTGERRSATVISATESVVFEIFQEPIVRIMHERPELADTLSRVLARRQLINERALDQHEEHEETEVFESFAGQFLHRMRDLLSASRLQSAKATRRASRSN